MKLEIEIAGKPYAIDWKPGEPVAMINGAAVPVDACLLRPGVLSLIIEGRACRVVLDEDPAEPSLHIGGERLAYALNDPRSLKARRAHTAGADGPRSIKASMPGRVVRILAQKGDAVEAHQGVVVIEAMKMQNELKSPKAGKVAELRVVPGDTVAAGDVLAVIE